MNFFKNNIDKTLEKILNNFLSKIKYGTLYVEFPSGEKKIYSGIKEGLIAYIKIHNYNFISYIFKRGSVGYAEAYIKGFYSTPNKGINQVRIAYVLNVDALQHAINILEAAIKVYPGRI